MMNNLHSDGRYRIVTDKSPEDSSPLIHVLHMHLDHAGDCLIFVSQLKAMETAYVVKMHNVCPLSKPLPTFAFIHPNSQWPDHIDNSRFTTIMEPYSCSNQWIVVSRYSKLSWKMDAPATIHGLAGYFESRL